MIKSFFWVALGSGLGGVSRVFLSGVVSRRWGTAFPWGTGAVNLLGCFLMGLFWGWTETRLRWAPASRGFLLAGFCGGFTTFSTFAMDTAQIFRSGPSLLALTYMAGSAVLGVLSFWGGAALGK